MAKLNIGLTGRLKLEQKQKLSPQMLITAELLQKPILELEQALKKELNINPFLENMLTEEENLGDVEPEDELTEEDEEGDLADKINEVNEIINDLDEMTNANFEYEKRDKSHRNYEKYEGYEVEVKDFWELFTKEAKEIGNNDDELEFIKAILNSLDDKGRLNASLEVLKEGLELTQERAEEIHTELMGIYPRGISARNLAECLIAQLEPVHLQDDILVSILQDDLELLENRKYKKLSKKYKVDKKKVKNIYNIISHLDPKPISRISVSNPSYIKPDIVVKEIDNELEIIINNAYLPEIKVNKRFARKLLNKKGNKKETIKYIKSKLTAAENYVQAILMRQETLDRIANEIVSQQPVFFKEGIKELRPMTYEDIAKQVDRDVSTVCRVVNSKFMDTPNGVFPLKWFFSSKVGENSSQAIKLKMKSIIENEDKSKPLSDRKIKNRLNDMGIKISLRAVTKYRNKMGIPVSRLRKE